MVMAGCHVLPFILFNHFVCDHLYPCFAIYKGLKLGFYSPINLRSLKLP